MTSPTDEEVRKIAAQLNATLSPGTGVSRLASWCLDRLSAGSGWRLISEYDQEKHGNAILGYFGTTSGDEPPDMSVVCCVYGKWVEPTFPHSELDEPTHFMSLPSPPGEG